MRARIALIVLALLCVSCGSNEPAAITTSTTSEQTSTSAQTSTTTALSPTVSMSLASTTTTLREIDVEFSGGEVAGPDTIEVGLSETVDLWILSDVDDEMHVHGYDLFYELEAGVPFHLTFIADVPGIFEVEVHTGHTRLFDLEVSG